MGRHSASGPGSSPNDGGDQSEPKPDVESTKVPRHDVDYTEPTEALSAQGNSDGDTDTGSWQRSHRRTEAGRRGVSRGLILAVATILVVALGVGLWHYFDGRKNDRGVEAAATCVHGNNSIAVVADPTISDQITEFSKRFNKTNEVIGDYCFTVAVRAADASDVIKGLTGAWPAELGAQPALWIPGSSLSTARLKAAAKTNMVIDSRSLVQTPVVIAMPPKLRQAITPDKGWTDLPVLQSVPNSLDALGLPDWGSLRLALPTTGDAGASLLAAEAVAAAGVQPGDPVDQGAAMTVVSAAPKPPIASLNDAMGTLLDAADQAAAPVHAVVTTEQQLFVRTRSNPDAKKVVASWRPAGATAVADYPTVLLDGSWVSEEQRSAASQFAHFLSDNDQLKDLASDGFRAGGINPPSSDIVNFAAIENSLTLDDKVRVALAEGTASSPGTTTIMLSSSPPPDVRLSDITSALASRVRTVSPDSAVGLWVYDGKEGNTVVRLGASTDNVEGVMRSQSIADALTSLQPTSDGAVAYTTLRALYQEAVGDFRPNQINSVLVVAGHSHTDQTLDGPGLIDTINKLKDPAKPVRINVIDFGSDSDQPTWQAVAQQTGGAYQDVSGANTPDLSAAIARFLS